MRDIKVDHVKIQYDEHKIFDDLQLSIPLGKVTIFLGPNGCGKSTLLKAIARLLKPTAGGIYIDQEDVHKIPTKVLAKQLGILPQSPITPEGITVFDLVKQGRFPHHSLFSAWTKEDTEIVENALHLANVWDLKDRNVDSLSGGQRQRVWVAMCLAQNTDIILLDEVTTYLDMTHQIEVLDLVYKLNQEQQKTFILVLHDINMAVRYAEHLIVLKGGEVYAEGAPEDIMTKQLLSDVFEMDCEVIANPLDATPLIIPTVVGRRSIGKKISPSILV